MEFITLLDEEWEKLSAKKKEAATEKARHEIEKRDQAALATPPTPPPTTTTTTATAAAVAATTTKATTTKATTTTATTTADKQTWVQNVRAGFSDAKENKRSKTKQQSAKARVAGRCAISRGLCIATDN